MSFKQTDAEKKTIHVGWDSEYQETKIISHQLYIYETQTEIFIDLIKENKGSITFSEVIGRIIEVEPDVQVIMLVSHFSRAEFSSLSDGRETVLGSGMTYSSKTYSGNVTEVQGVKVVLKDTNKLFLKSLEAVGKLVGIEKIDIAPYQKNKMLDLYNGDYDLFRRYAMIDAIIAVTAYLKTVDFLASEGMTIANTVGGIGERYLHKVLKTADNATLKGLGYEIRQYKDKKGIRHKELVVNGVIEERFEKTMHGGRNEVYYRGIVKDRTFSDYDLASAYTTMQALTPTWDITKAKHFQNPAECYDYLKENPQAHGRVEVEYIEHRQGVKYPIIAIKNDDSLIFVSSAHNCYLTAKEFCVAYPDIEVLQGFHGIVYPVLKEHSIVSEFLTHIRERRSHHKKGKNKFGDSLLKDIGNSTYGKFTQGYADKTGIDLKHSTKDKIISTPVPLSMISNPMVSTWVTGGIRAMAYEILNELERIGIRAYYWTTDGFVIDRDVPDYILNGEFGLWCRYVSACLLQMTGNRQILEMKHKGKGWLGIKTRGYAMIERVEGHDPLFSLTGIQMKQGSTHEDKATFLLSEVATLSRFKDTRYSVNTLTSVRDWLTGADFKSTTEQKGFNYDWDNKRKPINLTATEGMVSFDTTPFKNEDAYLSCRNDYDDFKRGTRQDKHQIGVKNKLLTLDHYREFDNYRLSRELTAVGIKHVTKSTPERLMANYLCAVKAYGYKRIAKVLGITHKIARNAMKCKLTIDNPDKVIRLVTSWLDRKLDKGGALCEYIGTKDSQRAPLIDAVLDYLAWLQARHVELTNKVNPNPMTTIFPLHRMVGLLYVYTVIATVKTIRAEIVTRYNRMVCQPEQYR